MASSLRLICRRLNTFQKLDSASLEKVICCTPTVSSSRRKQFRESKCRRYSEAVVENVSQNKQDALHVLTSMLNPEHTNEQVIDKYNTKVKGKEYDQYVGQLEYIGPKRMAETAASVLPDFKDAKILDVGAGSGLGGVAMRAVGFTNMDALEPSIELLKVAEAKNVYKKTFCHLLGSEDSPFEDNSYDMVVMAGVMIQGHLPKEAMVDLIRIVKPGGYIVNVFRETALRAPWYGEGLEPYFNKLQAEGKWSLIERRQFPKFLGDVHGVSFVHRVQ